ncbi:MAG TPA: hypothetical protein VFA89_05440 [Terriglobales bacterium]|nr:hypothetical protein [Terriglobales bacterium]
MRKIVFLACLFCGTAAFAQNAAVLTSSPMVSVYSPYEHRQGASRKDMADFQNLRGSNGYRIEHGERPLWEFAIPSHELPLGDVARMYRQEHATMKKAEFHREN